MSNRISVIIQSHNRPEGLKRALFSLQMQTFKDFEVVISDDSDDESQISRVLIGPAATGLDIHFKHTGPCGAAESMREAYQRSRFGYIKILHDDDWLTPRSLECQSLALDSNWDTNAVYGRAMICYPHEDRAFYAFAEKALKIPSSQWVAHYEATGLGPVQSPVTALFRRHPGFRVMWDEFINPALREAARKTGAGTDVSLQVDNAGSNTNVILLPYITCFLGTDMNSCTQTDKNISSYYEMWKQEYATHPKWRY
jgi:hypothetical protein